MINLVTDTVAGPNLRMRDKVLQVVAVASGTIIGTGLVAVFGPNIHAGPAFVIDWKLGAGLGAVVGMTVGLLITGVFLMIFRGARHARGWHDGARVR